MPGAVIAFALVCALAVGAWLLLFRKTKEELAHPDEGSLEPRPTRPDLYEAPGPNGDRQR